MDLDDIWIETILVFILVRVKGNWNLIPVQFPELRLQNPIVALSAVHVVCGTVVAWYPFEHTYETQDPTVLLIGPNDWVFAGEGRLEEQ